MINRSRLSNSQDFPCLMPSHNATSALDLFKRGDGGLDTGDYPSDDDAIATKLFPNATSVGTRVLTVQSNGS